MQKQECIAMLLAGGQGSRLGSLTRNIAKPAVSFCGKYRIIDFSLSNCANSNIHTVGVLTQYKPFLLNSYIGLGSAWNLDNPFGGVHILPPYVGEHELSWYKGTANAIYQNLNFINFYDPDYVLIISGDHIYTMNYLSMLNYHKEKGAEITISTIEVPWEEVARFGIVTTNKDGRIIKFTEKLANPDSNLASMGIYIFNWPVLKQALFEDALDQNSENDFGKNIIPKQIEQGRKLYAYNFQGYWRDVGTIESYYNANMEFLEGEEAINLFDPALRVFSNEDILPPQFIGPKAKISNSLISNGCVVLGDVSYSILAPGAYVGEGSSVKNSILLPHARVSVHSKIDKTIIGENAKIMSYCSIGIEKDTIVHQAGITVVEDHYVVGKGSVVNAGSNLYSTR
ncbi:glucose-1-phosphate adenylyltransferase [Desulfosporosinus acidiphilus SJ4]|uniref:Glucose-1-phosphate adenylyltransferase n=1 Tax=Desulfosporosinus acidiphilus (strain DSM 22704 / JCM 16185 / SJ4) TaxID=646529 RepID=I4D2K7_DESAJ|nr:glucose-1-phosphate adenylyltransferase [Desulfosporosinus acidiphilus]AFM40031.1 glucose-1-phosphate adenylyltransferase [Desulfosporosinus acidiphilus SJ4]